MESLLDNGSFAPWAFYAKSMQKVVVFPDSKGKLCYQLFSGFNSPAAIESLADLDASEADDMTRRLKFDMQQHCG